MNLRLTALSLLLFFSVIPGAFASGKKAAKSSVTVHLQTEGSDNPKMIFEQLTNGQKKFFRRLPEIGNRDILSYSPFPSEVGDGYGIVLKLKPTAANRFGAITAANQGRWMVAQVNGRVVDGVMIDKQITDGVFIVWKGLSIADINLLDADLPRIGEEGKKKK